MGGSVAGSWEMQGRAGWGVLVSLAELHGTAGVEGSARVGGTCPTNARRATAAAAGTLWPAGGGSRVGEDWL